MGARRSQVYDNLSHLVAAGVPIVRATRTAGGTTRGKISRALVSISSDLERGSTFGEALRQRPQAFPPLDVMVLDVADNSGHLPDGLRMLSSWYELMARIKRKVISGMVLPIVVLNMAAFVYPLPTMLIKGGMTWQGYLLQVFEILLCFYVPIVVVVTVVKLSSGRSAVRGLLDSVAIRIPVLGWAIRDMALARYCHACAMMAKAGVPAITTAQDAALLTGNAVMGARLGGGADAARAGNLISEGFSHKLPADFVEMWKVGEETGDMERTAARMAARYEESADRKFVELATWLPRIFYFFVCAMIVMMIFKMLGVYVGTWEHAGDM
jgi:type IV pilus assembly protein PilC